MLHSSYGQISLLTAVLLGVKASVPGRQTGWPGVSAVWLGELQFDQQLLSQCRHVRLPEQARPSDRQCLCSDGQVCFTDSACVLMDRRASLIDCACVLTDRRASLIDCACVLMDRRASLIDCACVLMDRRASLIDCACVLMDRCASLIVTVF